MKRFIQSAAIAALLVGGASLAFAQTDDSSTNSQDSSSSALANISYPIADLGNCDSREACKLYCDDSSHRDACFTFAQANGLMTKEKIAVAKLVLSKKGPGSCGSRDECISYCSDSSHQDECLSFAQEHEVIASSTVMLIKRLNSGEGPGACKSSQTCKMYCEDSSHESECRSFAEENGLLRRTASSTAEQVKGILASTTPGLERGMELHDRASSTTPAASLKVQPRSASTTLPRPTPPPSPESDNLGASVLRGFAKLLGF